MNTGVKEREGVDRKLPDGWKWVRLGDICKIQNGYAFKSNSFLDKGIPVIKMGNINKNFSLNWEIDKLSYLPINYLEIYSTFLVQKNDLLITLTDMSPSGEYLGTVAVYNLDSQALLNQRVGKFIDLSQDIDNNYLYFSLRDERFRKYATLDDKGNLQKNTNPDYLYKYDFPLPPLAEQKRIAAILNEQMEAVEKARKATEAQLEAAKELPAAYLRAVFNSPEAQKWERKKLKHICNKITDGTHQSPTFTSEGIPFLFVRNIVSGQIDFNVTQYVSESTYKELTKRCRPEKGDILYSAVGSFGVAVVVETDKPFTFQRHIAHLKPISEEVDSFYLASYINSPEGRRQSDKAALGVAQRTVTLTFISDFEIPIPSLQKQRQIVCELKGKNTHFNVIHNSLKSQLEAINKLPGAILRKAFNGEL